MNRIAGRCRLLAYRVEWLRCEGLNFGMAFEEADGDLLVTNPGTPPAAAMAELSEEGEEG